MGWLRSVGSITLQVSFEEYWLFYRALLQNRRKILSILMTEATPYVCPDSFIMRRPSPIFPICDMSHMIFIRVTWLIHICYTTIQMCTWLIHMCDMTHSCVWFDSFICVTRLIQMCDMTHSCVWFDSYICVTRLIHMCDMPHSYGVCDSSTRVTWLIHVCPTMTHS